MKTTILSVCAGAWVWILVAAQAQPAPEDFQSRPGVLKVGTNDHGMFVGGTNLVVVMRAVNLVTNSARIEWELVKSSDQERIKGTNTVFEAYRREKLPDGSFLLRDNGSRYSFVVGEFKFRWSKGGDAHSYLYYDTNRVEAFLLRGPEMEKIK